MTDAIVTARLVLRRARASDLGAIHAILSDARAMRFWSTPPHTDIEQSRQWLRAMVEADPAASDDYVVELEGAVIGKAGCWRMPEVGFILHPAHWGRGYAREALAAIIPCVLARHGVGALVADVDPRNGASVGLLTRLGFRETGRAARTYEIAGEWSDSVYFALDRDDWAAVTRRGERPAERQDRT